jgi:hypothetical protein
MAVQQKEYEKRRQVLQLSNQRDLRAGHGIKHVGDPEPDLYVHELPRNLSRGEQKEGRVSEYEAKEKLQTYGKSQGKDRVADSQGQGTPHDR